ncbi:O-antigen ligase family protein [Actinomycetospora aeridis]|uniref:O-antigen ligase family protein n=1 Tax=Actinomycetospora aeridis TaxID=3129231 RepID=A0ABU8N6E9_9PSEU
MTANNLDLVPFVAPALLVLASFGLVLVLLVTSNHRRSILAVAVGASGGLEAIQVLELHAFVPVAAGWLVVVVLVEREPPGRATAPTILLVSALLLAVTALIGPLVNSPLIGLQLIALALTAAAIALWAKSDDLERFRSGLLAAISISSGIGLLQYLGIIAHPLFFGENRPSGLYSEPDWLGMYGAVGIVLALYVKRPVSRIPLVALNSIAVLLASARAAWVAIAVLLALLIAERLLVGRWSDYRKIAGPTLIGALSIGAIVLFTNPALQDTVFERFAGAFSNERDVSANARLQQQDSLYKLAEDAPWYGAGLSASGRVGLSGFVDYHGVARNNVASNWILGWWADGKLLAIPLISILALLALRARRRCEGQVLIVTLLCSLFSNAAYKPITWLAAAMCVGVLNLSGPTSGREADEPGRSITTDGR